MIKKNNIITKTNLFNQITADKLTLNQIRFFCVYLSRINPKDVNSRKVTFTLNEFTDLLELERVRTENIQKAVNELLTKLVTIKSEDGNVLTYQLFSECLMYKNNDIWYITIDAHNNSLPLFFEFKRNFFSYQLLNILKLKSVNQIRMYEILKQYEPLGKREIDLEELKEFLGVEENKYNNWTNFKKFIINSAQTALKKNTDIEFDYTTKTGGAGGKVKKVIFEITKNKSLIKSDKELEEEFIQENTRKYEELEKSFKSKKLFYLAEACKFEFNEFELQILFDLIIKIIPWSNSHSDIEQYDYLKLKYDELNYRASQKEIKSRFGYIKKLLQLDIEE